MKRDFDLIRKILKEVEAWEPGYRASSIQCDGVDQAVVNEHIALMFEANLLCGISSMSVDRRYAFQIERLSWDGHEFLQTANDSVWQLAKETILKPGAGIAFDLLKEWLKKNTPGL